MLKNGLHKDFLENEPKDFANIGNLNEPNDTLPNASVLKNSGSGVMDRFWMMQSHSFGSLG